MFHDHAHDHHVHAAGERFAQQVQQLATELGRAHGCHERKCQSSIVIHQLGPCEAPTMLLGLVSHGSGLSRIARACFEGCILRYEFGPLESVDLERFGRDYGAWLERTHLFLVTSSVPAN